MSGDSVSALVVLLLVTNVVPKIAELFRNGGGGQFFCGIGRCVSRKFEPRKFDRSSKIFGNYILFDTFRCKFTLSESSVS